MRLLFLSDTHLGFDLPIRPRAARPRRGPLPYPLLALHPRLHLFDRPRTVTLEAGGLRVAFAGFPHAAGVRARFPALLAEARAREQDGPADLRLLLLHQCVEGATCGPGDFTFRSGPDVVRRADLPRDAAAVLCGHVHRHQVLAGRGGPPVIYAGSTERTSSAEAGERKVTLVLTLSARGIEAMEARAMPERPPPRPRPRWGAGVTPGMGARTGPAGRVSTAGQGPPAPSCRSDEGRAVTGAATPGRGA